MRKKKTEKHCVRHAQICKINKHVNQSLFIYVLQYAPKSNPHLVDVSVYASITCTYPEHACLSNHRTTRPHLMNASVCTETMRLPLTGIPLLAEQEAHI